MSKIVVRLYHNIFSLWYPDHDHVYLVWWHMNNKRHFEKWEEKSRNYKNDGNRFYWLEKLLGVYNAGFQWFSNLADFDETTCNIVTMALPGTLIGWPHPWFPKLHLGSSHRSELPTDRSHHAPARVQTDFLRWKLWKFSVPGRASCFKVLFYVSSW